MSLSRFNASSKMIFSRVNERFARLSCSARTDRTSSESVIICAPNFIQDLLFSMPNDLRLRRWGRECTKLGTGKNSKLDNCMKNAQTSANRVHTVSGGRILQPMLGHLHNREVVEQCSCTDNIRLARYKTNLWVGHGELMLANRLPI